MGQYYLPYVKAGNKIKVFENKVGKQYVGLKLMEHSYWNNLFVGNVINELFYKKAHVCWVGDYYNENNFAQVNCDEDEKDLVREIGETVWKEDSEVKTTKCTKAKSRTLTGCLLINHTKKEYINCNEYFERSMWIEEWEGKKYPCCVNPLPLLTCSANHSGGSYYGINQQDCGIWFYDILEVVYDFEEEKLIKKGYIKQDFKFKE